MTSELDIIIEKTLEERPDNEMDTLIRLYGTSEEALYIHLEEICYTPRSYNAQVPMVKPKKPLPLPSPPPLTITPLLVSGPTENRVDLV